MTLGSKTKALNTKTGKIYQQEMEATGHSRLPEDNSVLPTAL